MFAAAFDRFEFVDLRVDGLEFEYIARAKILATGKARNFAQRLSIVIGERLCPHAAHHHIVPVVSDFVEHDSRELALAAIEACVEQRDLAAAVDAAQAEITAGSGE